MGLHPRDGEHFAFRPLEQVACASGSVTPQERQTALWLAEWRDIKLGSPAWQQLSDWPDVRPSDEFFLTTLRIIREVFPTHREIW